MTTPANESEIRTGDEIVFSNYENLKAKQNRYQQLNKFTKRQLCAQYRDGVRNPDGDIVRYLGGKFPPEQWRKDEVINAIMDIEFP